ncbi:hypothetical protein BOTBODRAFT_117543 [Botryobasidium botryosum FD-172 SS1]|uniref:Snf7-domain-containing protein n=1 Tax=Botryobasidium botryosum (strain FD-172 SS1) TaxID=930990 RepID=A0A067M0T3_BOTB1|nr:hypothetical protein BOTBODRAFT_117543 [Botryobasidium botryosum FD-172 SS1]
MSNSTQKSSLLTTHLLSITPYSSSSTPARLQSLYSDFSRQKLSNPAGYAANVSWWQSTLSSIVAAGVQPVDNGRDVLVLRVTNELVEGLRWERIGRPGGLGTVIAELTESRALILLSDFLSATQSIYASSSLAYRVASYIVGRPLWWLLEQANLVGGDSAVSEKQKWERARGTYVVISLVESAAEAVLEHQRTKPGMSITDALYSLSSFRDEFANVALPGVTLSETDVKVLLTYLQRDKRVLVSEKEVIKFIDEDEVEAEITEVDRGVLDMKTTSERLQEQIDEIQRKIEDRTSRVKEHLRKKQQELAMSYLRSKKQLEELLKKRLGSLETIQSVLLKIESAAGDIEIMKTYETSTKTLKSLLAHPTLQRDHIDKTMESMSDVFADHAEIEEAIRMGGEDARRAGGVEDADEDELQAELQMLVKEEKEREEKEQREKEEREKIERERLERERERRAKEAREEAEERRRALALASKVVPPSVPDAGDVDEEAEKYAREESERATRDAMLNE